MDRLYYTYLIIKESLDYIPAVEIKKQLEENYQIKVDIKTVYQAIRNINELSKYIYQKEIIKTKHRKGYSIDEEFFNDGQFSVNREKSYCPLCLFLGCNSLLSAMTAKIQRIFLSANDFLI